MAATKIPISVVSSSVKSVANDRTMVRSKPQQRPAMSAFEARVSLLFALASQSASLSQRVVADIVAETAKYVVPKKYESRNLEEALMAVPDLETMNFKVLSKKDQYDIREVESYFIAETAMPGREGFDFLGASQSFNVLAEYLFGKNMPNEKMEMTTPVITRKVSDGDRMEMTTPVITRKVGSRENWNMSFVMPSKYGSNLPKPKDSAVRITEVPKRIVAVAAFSGYVTEEEVKRRESKLRDALKKDLQFEVKVGAEVEVAQYNPPFTLPFTRRNEITLAVQRRKIND